MISHSLNAALYELKESGEVRIQDLDLLEILERELKEMGISYDKYQEFDVWVINIYE
jgi:hypothetical protein